MLKGFHRVKTICNLIINTADNTIEELRRKYPIGMPTLDNLIGDAQNRYKLEACRKFVKEYRFLPDVKFTEAAKMASLFYTAASRCRKGMVLLNVDPEYQRFRHLSFLRKIAYVPFC